jgi:hypothetical protein
MSTITIRLGTIDRFSHVKSDEHWVKVSSFKEAKEVFTKYQDEECFDNYHLLGGDVKVDGIIKGIFSPNGLFFAPEKEGNDCYELLPGNKKLDIIELDKLKDVTIATGFKEITVYDPDTNELKCLLACKDPKSGKLFAVESSYIGELPEYGTIFEPFSGDKVLIE